MSRPDWSRSLPRPLTIPKVMVLRTLADARALMRHLPADRRQQPTWTHVASELAKGAAGGDVASAAIALRLVLMLERVDVVVGR